MHTTKGCLEGTAQKWEVMEPEKRWACRYKQRREQCWKPAQHRWSQGLPHLDLPHTTRHQDELNASQQPRDPPVSAFTASLCLSPQHQLAKAPPQHICLWHFFSWLLNPLPRTGFYFALPSKPITKNERLPGCRAAGWVSWECGMTALVFVTHRFTWENLDHRKETNPQFLSWTHSKSLLRII